MIPDFDDGVLPDGVHDCTAEEVAARFGRFQRTDRRARLTERLMEYLDAARQSGIVAAVILDGSYVTARDDPDDIDLIVARRVGVDTTALRPFEYNAISKRMIRSLYKIDALSAEVGSETLAGYVEFFARVNPLKPHGFTSRTTKGLLRIVL